VTTDPEVKPKWGGYVVSAWLAGIVANLSTRAEYRDIALRDIGLARGAVALARVAADSPRERVVVSCQPDPCCRRARVHYRLYSAGTIPLSRR